MMEELNNMFTMALQNSCTMDATVVFPIPNRWAIVRSSLVVPSVYNAQAIHLCTGIAVRSAVVFFSMYGPMSCTSLRNV